MVLSWNQRELLHPQNEAVVGWYLLQTYLVGFLCQISFGENKDDIYKQDVINGFFVYYIFLNYFVIHFYCASITFAGGRLTKSYVLNGR